MLLRRSVFFMMAFSLIMVSFHVPGLCCPAKAESPSQATSSQAVPDCHQPSPQQQKSEKKSHCCIGVNCHKCFFKSFLPPVEAGTSLSSLAITYAAQTHIFTGITLPRQDPPPKWT